MKKNVFALSVAAALAVLAGSASAQVVSTATATEFEVNAGGIGHIQLIPYYTVQNSNNTLLNIVNTDSKNGKAVKVRFRGARNSDDVFDFYLLLSPGDVWRSRVYKDEAGNTRLDLNGDTTCTYPANAVVEASAFPTTRVFNGDVAETREGYVELLTAADIPVGSDLYTAIKHVNGEAPCYADDAINNAFKDVLESTDDAEAAGFAAPSTGLIANWAVMNVETGSTASGNGTALQAINAAGAAAWGNIVIAPQSDVAAPHAWVGLDEEGNVDPDAVAATADPLFTANVIDAGYYDFPDLSTPYLTDGTASVTAAAQANLVSNALAVSQIINEFTTVEAGFKTDWVFSLPTRRYGVAIDYGTATRPASAEFNADSAFFTEKVGNNGGNATFDASGAAPAIYITLNGTYWDKEENNSVTQAPPSGPVISPSTPAVPAGLPYISGEVNVFTFNGNAPDSILGGTIAYNNITPTSTAGANIESGWANFDLARPANGLTTGLNGAVVNGLPVIGYATMTAGNGINLTYAHRFNQDATAITTP